MNASGDRTELSEEVNERLRRELEDGETLLWADKPVPGAYARQAWPIGLFGIPFFLFSIFWMAGAGAATWFGGSSPAQGGGAGLFSFFPLFGIPFVLVGLFLVTAPMRERVKARRVAYGVTDRRAIMITPKFGGEEVKSFAPRDLGTITRRERRDGVGDVVFGEYRGLMLVAAQSGRNPMPQLSTPGFVGVRRVREVERIVRALAETGQSDDAGL